MADEALQEAVRFYRECRELCVDLLADVEDEKGDAFFQRQSHGDVAAAAKAISESRSVLLRAEFNLGMALVDQKNHGDAVPHLLAVQEGFRELAKTSPMLSSPAGSVDDPTQTGDGASDLKSLYASSLALLGDCYASSSAASMPLSAILQADNQGYGREGRKPGNDTAATSKAPMPLGAQSGPTPARLSAAIEALEKAAYTFLEIRDAGGALDVLDRLVKILRLLGHSRGGACYVSRAETLCDRASHALSLLRSRERAGSGGSEEEDANNAEHESAEAGLDLKQDLQQIRDDLFNLRERWYDGGSGDGCSNGGPGHRAVDENRSVRRSVVRRMDSIEQGNSESSAAGVGRAREEAGAMSRSHEFQPPSGGGTRTSTGADPGCQQLGRIGPALSAPAFARRRRARTKDGMLPVSLGRTTGSRGRAHGGGRGTPVDARQVSVRNDSRGQIMRGDVLASEIERGGKQLGHDNAKSGSTGTTGECGDTFVQLRAALAAAVDESAQARKHMAEGRGVLSAYKETVSTAADTKRGND